jgi:hypothetical protein
VLIHALSTRGKNWCIPFRLNLERMIISSGGELEFARICLGGACIFMYGELFVSPELEFAHICSGGACIHAG